MPRDYLKKINKAKIIRNGTVEVSGKEISIRRGDGTLITTERITKEIPVTFGTYSKRQEVESHKNFIDIHVYQKGEERMFVGGNLLDGKEVSPGEKTGLNLSDDKEMFFLSKGDILIIPAGVPHCSIDGTGEDLKGKGGKTVYKVAV